MQTGPRIADVEALLGEAFRHHQAGHLAEAANLYRKILTIDARHADCLHLLGVVAHQTGDHAAAIDLMSKAIGVRGDVAMYHHNLGNALHAQGRLGEAVAQYECAIALDSNVAEMHCNLGNALQAQGKLDDALVHYERTVALKPDFVQAYCNLGCALQARGRLEEAVARFEHAVMLAPNVAEVHHNLANALSEQNRLADAVVHYQHAVMLKPDFAQCHGDLACALRDLGRLIEAQRAYERAIELAPRTGLHYRHLLNTKRVVGGDPHLAAMESMAREMNSLPPEDQKQLHFALGKAYADLGQQERSFRHLLAGNALKRAEFVYDEAAALGLFDRVRAVFTPDVLHDMGGLGDPSRMPIFIIGMPRSGTTLVEQILASHPHVFGAGERDDFARAAVTLRRHADAGLRYPEVVPGLPAEALRGLAASYLHVIRATSSGARHVTDKMPSNASFAGLIHLALPNARIIHVSRDPIDTCVSCFATLFGSGQPYSYDLAELGRHYHAHESLMQHWRAVLPPETMLEVRYEDVVADVERQARQIVAYCGLAWDDSCLGFYKTSRPVRTASALQVRQPIYHSSVGRWQPYKPFLQPLIDALRAAPTMIRYNRER
jgi:tetratricopeptide (TPR) repeat protein